MQKKNVGFTLIELLIVVAIIAILAAIAIPNFLAAQTRSKVSRVKGDMRTINTAIEAYDVDENVYPLNYDPVPYTSDSYPYYLSSCLTTPISYISKGGQSGEQTGGSGILMDPFRVGRLTPGYSPIILRYRYVNFENNWVGKLWSVPDSADGIQKGKNVFGSYMIICVGPDRRLILASSFDDGNNANDWLVTIYDPSNGTVSNGEVVRSQKEPNVTMGTYYNWP